MKTLLCVCLLSLVGCAPRHNSYDLEAAKREAKRSFEVQAARNGHGEFVVNKETGYASFRWYKAFTTSPPEFAETEGGYSSLTELPPDKVKSLQGQAKRARSGKEIIIEFKDGHWQPPVEGGDEQSVVPGATRIEPAPPEANAPDGPPKEEKVEVEPISHQRDLDKPGPDLSEYEAEVFRLMNYERKRHGLRPLVIDEVIQDSARKHCKWMADSNNMTHGGPYAENIAMGQGSPKEVMNTWMNSSGHRANILGSGYGRFGCAAMRRGNGPIFWCQRFAGAVKLK